MNKNVAKMWSAYLRKPGLKQHLSALGDPKGTARCCLGHLCDIAVEQGVIPPPVTSESQFILFYGATDHSEYGDDRNDSYLPNVRNSMGRDGQ